MNAKTEEMSLKRLVTVKWEKLAATEIRFKKIYEDTEQRKQAITEYEFMSFIFMLLGLLKTSCKFRTSILKKTHMNMLLSSVFIFIYLY